MARDEGGLAILTAWHSVGKPPRNLMNVRGPICRVWLMGRWYSGKLLMKEPGSDLAVFYIRHPDSRSVKRAVIADEVSEGQYIQSRGYFGTFINSKVGTKQTFRVVESTLRFTLSEQFKPFHLSTKPFAYGESGGGVYNRKGQLVGLIHGYTTNPRNHPDYINGVRGNIGVLINLKRILRFVRKNFNAASLADGGAKFEPDAPDAPKRKKPKPEIEAPKPERTPEKTPKQKTPPKASPPPKPKTPKEKPSRTVDKPEKPVKQEPAKVVAEESGGDGVDWASIAIAIAGTAAVGTPAGYVIAAWKAGKFLKKVRDDHATEKTAMESERKSLLEGALNRISGDMGTPSAEPINPVVGPAPTGDKLFTEKFRELERKCRELEIALEYEKNETSKVREYVHYPVDKDVELYRQALDIAAKSNNYSSAFLGFQKLVENHFELLKSGRGI